MQPRLNLREFLDARALFTVGDLDDYIASVRPLNVNTRKALLSYYQQTGRIKRVRRGLYASALPDGNGFTYVINRNLVASKLAPDAVLAYHSAMEFMGTAYSLWWQVYYVSRHEVANFGYGDCRYRRIAVPSALQRKGLDMFGVSEFKRLGQLIRVTDLARTFVDAIDRPDLGGGWEEIWVSLELVNPDTGEFDLDQVVEYVDLLGNSTTAAKVGYLLEQQREWLKVDTVYLDALQAMRPKQPRYMDRGARGEQMLQKRWNLIVPDEVVFQKWNEYWDIEGDTPV